MYIKLLELKEGGLSLVSGLDHEILAPVHTKETEHNGGKGLVDLEGFIEALALSLAGPPWLGHMTVSVCYTHKQKHTSLIVAH